jgi:hypothetical protein
MCLFVYLKHTLVALGLHRYRKSKIDWLRFVMYLLLVPVFHGFFFSSGHNSTNEAYKAGGMHL